jgi:aprataxin
MEPKRSVKYITKRRRKNRNRNRNQNRKPKNLSLENSMNDELMQLFKDEEVVCIRDKFPKAIFHALLIPISSSEENNFMNLEQVLKSPDCFNFFMKLKYYALRIIDLLTNSIDKTNLQYRFHAIQTFRPLHMHIISKDFFSVLLDSQKKWNSFNTSYFIHLDDFIRHLDVDLDKCRIDYFTSDPYHLRDINYLENLLISSGFKCNVCQENQESINSLKEHLLTHA